MILAGTKELGSLYTEATFRDDPWDILRLPEHDDTHTRRTPLLEKVPTDGAEELTHSPLPMNIT